MRIVGVVRTSNADDIIEASLRHQLAFLDFVVVLDEGSQDRTVEILTALRAEGLPIEPLFRRSLVIDAGASSMLYARAVEAYGADWVAFFDAEDFLDLRGAGVSLRKYLAAIPADRDALRLRRTTYAPTAEDDAREALAPRRLSWRRKSADGARIALRRSAAPRGVAVDAEGRTARRGDREIRALDAKGVVLAHYPARSGWQEMRDVVIGGLRAAATGEAPHGDLRLLLQRPRAIFDHPPLAPPDRRSLTHDPIDYAGGALRYTRAADEAQKFVNVLLRHADALAREHGALAEAHAAVRDHVADGLRVETAPGSRRPAAQRDPRVETYLAGKGPHRLEIGAGRNGKPGWLATDLRAGESATGAPIIGLDATKPFPLPSNAFDYVYSEHMIEHIDLLQGLAMLAECRRILKPGGVLRIATPSLGFLQRVISPDRGALEERYREWSVKTFSPAAPAATNAVFLNNFVRNWGHTFIYDRETLRLSLERAGFAHIRECAFNESEHPALRGIENERRLPPGFLELETMVMEGSKGRASSRRPRGKGGAR